MRAPTFVAETGAGRGVPPGAGSPGSSAGRGRAFTPLLSRRLQLTRALEAATAEGVEVTDEAMGMERLGLRPLLVEGAESNFKITTRADLERFEFELSRRT